jgi:hypothetical protein
MKNTKKTILAESLNGGVQLEDLGVEGRMILK